MLTLVKNISAILVLGLCSTVMAGSPEVDLLIKQLKDKDESVRLKAAKELGKLKGKAADAIPALTAAADDPDEDVRNVAKRALDAIKIAAGGKEPKKIDKVALLIKDLHSKEPKVRLAAIGKLGEIGMESEAARSALVEFGMLSPWANTREAAFAAFEKLDSVLNKELVTLLTAQIDGRKGEAIDNMRGMGETARAAVPAIKKIFELRLKGMPAYVDHNSLSALAAIAPEDIQVQTLILGLVGAPDMAVDVIIDKGGGRRLRPLLVEVMNQTGVNNKQKYNALMKGLSSSKLEGYRALIIRELAKLGPDAKGALPTLTKLKLDTSNEVREAAAVAIEAIKE